MINLKRYSEIEALQCGLKVEGHFALELVHARSGLIAQRLEFKNIVVDAGLNALVSDGITTMMTYAAVGTGAVAPATTDSALGSELARTNSSGGFADTSGFVSAGHYQFLRRTRTFTVSQANGNLTEVGMFRNATGAPMLCRQLLKDASGNPTTITKTSEYELRVVYEFRVYPPLVDDVYNATVNGLVQSITSRASADGSVSENDWYMTGGLGFAVKNGHPSNNIGVYTGAIGTTGTKPTGTYASLSEWADDAYAAGSFQRSGSITWLADRANFTILSITTPGNGANYSAQWTFQHQLTTGITKSNTQKLVVKFNRTWGRYTP